MSRSYPSPVPDICPERGPQTRDEVATLVGLGPNGSTYERNAKVLDRIAESDPGLYEQAADGVPVGGRLMRETAAVAEGRLIVTAAAAGEFTATVRGSGDVHRVTFARGGWHCTCPARSTCSHLHAAWLIAAPITARSA